MKLADQRKDFKSFHYYFPKYSFGYERSLKKTELSTKLNLCIAYFGCFKILGFLNKILEDNHYISVAEDNLLRLFWGR